MNVTPRRRRTDPLRGSRTVPVQRTFRIAESDSDSDSPIVGYERRLETRRPEVYRYSSSRESTPDSPTRPRNLPRRKPDRVTNHEFNVSAFMRKMDYRVEPPAFSPLIYQNPLRPGVGDVLKSIFDWLTRPAEASRKTRLSRLSFLRLLYGLEDHILLVSFVISLIIYAFYAGWVSSLARYLISIQGQAILLALAMAFLGILHGLPASIRPLQNMLPLLWFIPWTTSATACAICMWLSVIEFVVFVYILSKLVTRRDEMSLTGPTPYRDKQLSRWRRYFFWFIAGCIAMSVHLTVFKVGSSGGAWPCYVPEWMQHGVQTGYAVIREHPRISGVVTTLKGSAETVMPGLGEKLEVLFSAGEEELQNAGTNQKSGSSKDTRNFASKHAKSEKYLKFMPWGNSKASKKPKSEEGYLENVSGMMHRLSGISKGIEQERSSISRNAAGTGWLKGYNADKAKSTPKTKDASEKEKDKNDDTRTAEVKGRMTANLPKKTEASKKTSKGTPGVENKATGIFSRFGFFPSTKSQKDTLKITPPPPTKNPLENLSKNSESSLTSPPKITSEKGAWGDFKSGLSEMRSTLWDPIVPDMKNTVSDKGNGKTAPNKRDVSGSTKNLKTTNNSKEKGNKVSWWGYRRPKTEPNIKNFKEVPQEKLKPLPENKLVMSERTEDKKAENRKVELKKDRKVKEDGIAGEKQKAGFGKQKKVSTTAAGRWSFNAFKKSAEGSLGTLKKQAENVKKSAESLVGKKKEEKKSWSSWIMMTGKQKKKKGDK